MKRTSGAHHHLGLEMYSTGSGGFFAIATPGANVVDEEEWLAYRRERDALIERVTKSLGLKLTKRSI